MPTLKVKVTELVAVSMTETLLEPILHTHNSRPSGVTAETPGLVPTVIGVPTVPVCVVTGETVPAPALEV